MFLDGLLGESVGVSTVPYRRNTPCSKLPESMEPQGPVSAVGRSVTAGSSGSMDHWFGIIPVAGKDCLGQSSKRGYHNLSRPLIPRTIPQSPVIYCGRCYVPSIKFVSYMMAGGSFGVVPATVMAGTDVTISYRRQ